MSREHHDEHTWGEAQKENSTDPSKCYDTVIKCTVCGAAKEDSRVHHDHDWGDETTNPYVETTPATTSSTGVETQYCLNDPSHTRTRTIPKLPAKTKITYRVYDYWYYDRDPNHEWYQHDLYYRHYNEGRDIVTNQEFDIGSKVRVTWTDKYYYDASYFINAKTKSGEYGGTWYWFPDEIPSSVSRNPQRWQYNATYTYSFEFTVTNNMVLDICLGYYIDPQNFTFTKIAGPTQSANSQNSSGKNSVLSKQSLSVSKMQSKTARSIKTAPALAVTPTASGKTAEEIMTYLNSIPNTASCKTGENHLYKEKLSNTYEVTATDNWKLPINDLDKYNQYGNPYTYYVVEKTENLLGYDVIYTGQDSGLQDNGEMTITNKRAKVNIVIKKVIAGTETPLEGVQFTLTPVDDRGNIDTNRIIEDATQTTDNDGLINFEGIAPGRYKVEEGTAPSGYVVTEGPYYINVTSDETDSVEDISSLKYIAVLGHEYTIQNEPGEILPNSGGPGTTHLYLLGLILTALAGAGLAMKRRTNQNSRAA